MQYLWSSYRGSSTGPPFTHKYLIWNRFKVERTVIMNQVSDWSFKGSWIQIPSGKGSNKNTFTAFQQMWHLYKATNFGLRCERKINLPLKCLVTVSLIIIFIHLLWCFYPFIPHHSLYCCYIRSLQSIKLRYHL